MRKKSLLHGKKLLAGLIAISMIAGLATTIPETKVYAAEQDEGLVYFVDCGDFNPETVPEGEKLGSSQSVTDRIYGQDTTGKKWGVVFTEEDPAITVPVGTDVGQNNHVYEGSKAVFTKYQWANQRLNGDAAITDSFRYARDQGANPKYVKYQFDVEPGEYQIAVGMGNTWGNAGAPDIYAGPSGNKESDTKLNTEALNIPQNGNRETTGTIQIENGSSSLYVYALSENDTIQMNYIRIVKVPENAVTSLKITAQPSQTEYYVGDELKTAGLELEVVYKNGDTKKVDASSCTLTGFDSSRAGEKTVTVSYTEGVTVETSFTVTVKKKPIAISEDPNLMYFVDCGDFDPETTSAGDAVGSSQSVTDRIYGEDKSGKNWGVVVTEEDPAITVPVGTDVGQNNHVHEGSEAVFTKYQWANQRLESDAANTESFRYARDQSAKPQYIKYQFDMEPGEYQVAVMMGNTWGNAANPDIYAGSSGNKESDTKLNAEALNIPENEHTEVHGTVQIESQSSLYVYALSEDATIQMNYIRIVKIPANSVTSLKITQMPDKLEYCVGEKELVTDGLKLQAVYKDGTTKEVEADACEFTGFDASKAGKQMITVSYTESVKVQTEFEVTVVKKPIVSADPNFIYFVDCGDFDPQTTSEGDTVGSSQSVTDRIYGEDKNGKKWGVVTAEEGEEIVAADTAAPETGSNAVFTTYQWANEKQTNDTPKENSFRYAHGQDDLTVRYVKYRFDVEPGQYQIITCMGNTWGNAANPDIYAGTTGDRETDRKINVDALEIPKGECALVTEIVQVPEGEGSLYVYAVSDDITIQMNYIKIVKISEDINLAETLEIVSLPEKTEYIVGEEFHTEGLVLRVKYKNGDTKEITASDCELSGFDSQKAGEKVIKVSYTEGVKTVRTEFTVTVKKLPIAVSDDPNLVYFVDCGDFDPETTSAGDAVGSSQSVTDRIYGEDKNGKKWGVVTSETDTEIENQNSNGGLGAYTTYQWADEKQTNDTPKESSFRYAREQDSFDKRYVRYRFDVEPGRYLVTVGVGNSWGNAANPDIYAGTTGNPQIDDKLNPEALKISEMGHKEVQKRVSVAEGKTSLEVYLLSEDSTIQVNYIRIEKVTAEEEILTGLRIKKPAKVEYQLNEAEELDTEGMCVYAVYNGGYEEVLPLEDCEVTGFSGSTLGTQIITVTYRKGEVSVNAVFEITVVEGTGEDPGPEQPTVKPVSLTIQPPHKTEYQLNEKLDLEGMILTVHFSDETERTVSAEECEISGFDSSIAGKKMVTVSYTENDITVEAVFQVTVVSEEQPESVIPVSLKVTPPNKTTYQVGENLNLEGMSVIVSCSDGTEKETEPEKCEISGFNSSKEGALKITVSYTEKEVTVEDFFWVEIVKKAEEKKTFRVFYHDNKGGSVSGMPSDAKEYAKGEKAAAAKAPVSTSKFFAGWNTQADGKGTGYAPGSTITVNGEVHLYAQWKTSYTAKNKLKYKVTGKQAVSCVGTANKKASSIKVPATIKYSGITYKVTSIGAKAFAKNKKIKKVTIANNVKTIKARAFENCKNLKSITVGTGLTTIEKYAFSGEKKGCVLTIKSKRLKTVKTAINHKTKNMTVKVPKSKLKAYKKLLKRKAKNVKVSAG